MSVKSNKIDDSKTFLWKIIPIFTEIATVLKSKAADVVFWSGAVS